MNRNFCFFPEENTSSAYSSYLEGLKSQPRALYRSQAMKENKLHCLACSSLMFKIRALSHKGDLVVCVVLCVGVHGYATYVHSFSEELLAYFQFSVWL
jgi:hypothetical protein